MLKKILTVLVYTVILGVLGFVVVFRFMRGCSMFVPH